MRSGKVMARRLAGELFTKLAFDIELMDVRRVCEYTNYFLFVSGKNKIHLDALKEQILEFAAKHEIKSYGMDGTSQSGWIIIDFGDVIIHLFHPEVRKYYDLMSIWGDAKPVELDLSEKPHGAPGKEKKEEK